MTQSGIASPDAPSITTSAPPRVAFVLGKLFNEAAGVSTSSTKLAHACGQLGGRVDVYTAECKGRPVARHLVSEPTRCITAPADWLGGLSRAPQLNRLLSEAISEIDVVHNHTLWMLPNKYASNLARKHRKPVVFSPRGSLDPWCLARSRWKKRIAGIWFQNRHLRQAACIHALTQFEVRSIRAFGLQNPVAIVPNGVTLTDYDSLPDREAFDRDHPEVEGKRICLSLSRLHKKKGLLHLVEAWSRLSQEHDDWQLVIAGPDDGLETQIRKLIKELDLDQMVTLTGGCFGAKKLAILSAASLFVLPSFSEGFSNAVLEAMACRLAALITPGCNSPEAIEAGAAIEVLPNVDDTERGLRTLLASSAAELAEMGRRGRALVEEKYTWTKVALEMLAVYRWLVGSGPPPDCVQLN